MLSEILCMLHLMEIIPVIKTVGDDKHLDITTSYLKGVENADSAVQARLFQGLKSPVTR